MKKTILTLILLIPLVASCSVNKAYKGADSDSSIVSEAVADLDSIDAIPLPTLTAEGLGQIKIGMPIDSLPEGIENLYDHVQEEDTPDASVLTFTLHRTPMFSIYNFGDGKVDVITLNSRELGFRTPEGIIHMGDPMEKVFQTKGVSTEYASADDNGQWYWRYEGLWICPDPAQCSPELAEALSSRNNPPSASLVSGTVTVGYIATGLPW